MSDPLPLQARREALRRLGLPADAPRGRPGLSARSLSPEEDLISPVELVALPAESSSALRDIYAHQRWSGHWWLVLPFWLIWPVGLLLTLRHPDVDTKRRRLLAYSVGALFLLATALVASRVLAPNRTTSVTGAVPIPSPTPAYELLSTGWSRLFDRPVRQVQVSGSGNLIAVITSVPGAPVTSIQVFTPDGQPVWRRDLRARITAASLSASGDLVALSTLDAGTMVLDGNGRNLWRAGGPVPSRPVQSQAAVASNGLSVAVLERWATGGANQSRLAAYDHLGHLRWTIPVPYEPGRRVQVSRNGQAIAVLGSSSFMVVDDNGHSLVARTGLGPISQALLTTSGRYLLLTGGGQLRLFDMHGNVMWHVPVGATAGLAASSNAEVVAVSLHLDDQITVLGRRGVLLWRGVGGLDAHVGISADGRWVAFSQPERSHYAAAVYNSAGVPSVHLVGGAPRLLAISSDGRLLARVTGQQLNVDRF